MGTMIKAGIVGATGYGGAELVRLLLGHPQAEITALSSVSFEGMRISEVYPSYTGLCDMICGTQQEVVEQCDVVFAALPHGLSQDLAQECHNHGKVFIDLGADFRLESEADYKEWYNGDFKNQSLHDQAVYAIPELFRDRIKGKKVIANPGCYPTAVALALAPALEKGLIERTGIIADCKSGVTGTGRNPSATTHYANLNESFYAYKIAAHRHTPEMEQTLTHMAGDQPVKLTFVPHLLPINRGILATCYARLQEGVTEQQVRETYEKRYGDEYQPVKLTFVPHLLPINRGILATCYARLQEGVTEQQVRETYEKRYGDECFIRLLPQGKSADVKQVRCSNFCDLSLHTDQRAGILIAISAIDNMVKGAAGQAIQNMNLAFGLEETAGLILVPPAF